MSGNAGAGSSSLLPPCRICGNVSSGFHYGVYTCEGCKVFYRRSLRRNVVYKCVGKGCEMDGRRKRGLCQACRFKKCEDLGMSVTAIRHGRYTHSVRAANIVECITSEAGIKVEPEDGRLSPQGLASSPAGVDESCPSSRICTPASSPSLLDMKNTITLKQEEEEEFKRNVSRTTQFDDPNERLELEHFVSQMEPLGVAASAGTSGEKTKAFLVTRCEYFLKKVGNKGPITVHTIDDLPPPDSLDSFQVSEAAQRWFPGLERGALSFISLVRDLPVFDDLPLLTKMQLVIDSKNEVWVVAVSQSMCLEHGFHTTIMMHTSPVLDLFGHWDRPLLRLLVSLVRRLQALQLTDQENAMLVALIILSTDRGEPGAIFDREKVDKLYQKCMRAFQCLVHSSRAQDKLFFAKIIEILTDLRTYNTLAHNFFASFKKTWPQVEATGIVNELFLTPSYGE